MKYFLDTEFIEDGKTIDLISIGIVAEDGRELYLENCSCNFSKADKWVRDNVLSHLKTISFDVVGRSLFPKEHFTRETHYNPEMIKNEVINFIADDPKPIFYAYYADYDWIVFCQLFGRMIDLPKHFPMYCRDLKQIADMLGNPKLPQPNTFGLQEHNALEDAKWNKAIYNWLVDYSKHIEKAF